VNHALARGRAREQAVHGPRMGAKGNDPRVIFARDRPYTERSVAARYVASKACRPGAATEADG
jgi:hypothetical protein